MKIQCREEIHLILITWLSDRSTKSSGENLRLLKESTAFKTLSRAFEVSALDSAVTLRFSGSLVGVTVCIRKLLFVSPNIDGATVGTKAPPGALSLGQSGGKCL